MHEGTGAADASDAGSAREAGAVPQRTLVTVPFDEAVHRCDQFACERSARVERFLKEDRLKLAGPRLANIFILPDRDDPGKILGYYCLSAGHIERELVSNRLRKTLPRDLAPMALLGFMGRDDSAPKGTGEILLADVSLRMSRNQDMAVWGIMLHAENDALVTWYAERGFKSTPDDKVSERNKRLMYAPLAQLIPR